MSDALRRFNIPPGDYCLPRASSMADMKNPAFMEKMKKGPVLLMTVLPNGQGAMGAQLTQWFFFSALVSVFAAYIAGRAVGPGANYLEGLPLRRLHGVRELRARHDPGLDLVQEELGHHAEVHLRRPGVRPAHGRDVRVVVAGYVRRLSQGLSP